MRRFYMGVDLGKRHDYSAITVTQRIDRFRDKYGNVGTLYRDEEPRIIETMFRVRMMEQFKDIPYTDVVERIGVLMSNNTLRHSTQLVVDATGVGEPVIDMLARTNIDNVPLAPIPIVITGGTAINMNRSGFTVPKRDIGMALLTVTESNRIKVSRSLPLAGVLKQQLEKFKIKINRRGHEQFEAAEGDHDDLVMSLAIAIWYATKGDPHGQRFHENYHPEREVLKHDPLDLRY